MKLRNKTTGEIVHVWEFIIEGRAYNSIKKLKEDYEDINPAEPLIKGEKVRKAVRAWANANEIPSNSYVTSYGIKGNWLGLRYSYGDKDWVVKLEIDSPKVNIEQDVYTIAELCGEEEE